MEKETVSHDMQTYDVLGNERHKAVCELRKINVDKLCEQYDYIDVYAQYVWAIGESLGIKGGGGFESIINRLIHLLGGDAQCDLTNFGKPCGESDAVLDASTICSTDRRREVVKRLKEYREHPPVRDVDGLIVEDTYSVGEVEGIVTGKETFTTGEYIDAIISLIDASNQSDGQSNAPESVENAESAASKDEIRDFDDTCERLESEIDEWCAEHFNSSFSGRACNLILEWLDRQEAITERNCRVEYEDMRDYLQAQVDRLTDENEAMRQALMDLRGILG